MVCCRIARDTYSKQASFGGKTTFWLLIEESGFRGRTAGGGIGFVTVLRDGETRFLGRESDVTESIRGEVTEAGINGIEEKFAIECMSLLQ